MSEITGRFGHNEESEFFNKMILFIPDEDSLLKIPKSYTDTRNIVFELKDYNDISEQFGQVGSSGKATVLIKDYYVVTIPTEVVNTAELVDVEDIIFDEE